MQKLEQRNASIIKLYSSGKTYREVAGHFNLSHQRIQQILNPKAPVSKVCVSCGGEAVRKYCFDCSLPGFTGMNRTREFVRRRDNHTCQSCGLVWLPDSGKKRHDVHHLNGLCGKKSQKYDKLDTMDGLITLCHKCHYNHEQFSQKL